VDDPDQSTDWRDFDRETFPPILRKALTCFAEQGYDGTPIRTIAAAVGLSVPGLYHHYASKQELLAAVMEHAISDLLDRTRAAVAEAGDDPLRRFDAVVESLVLFHAYRRDEAFVAVSELRALEPAHRDRLIGLRDAQEALLYDAVAGCVARGDFPAASAREAGRAVITMCTAVANWYHLGGRIPPEQLAATYVTLARRTMGHRDPAH